MCTEHREEDVVVVWKKSAKACFQIQELPRSVQLMRSLQTWTLFISVLLKRTKLWMMKKNCTNSSEWLHFFIFNIYLFSIFIYLFKANKGVLEVKPNGQSCTETDGSSLWESLWESKGLYLNTLDKVQKLTFFAVLLVYTFQKVSLWCKKSKIGSFKILKVLLKEKSHFFKYQIQIESISWHKWKN